MSSYWFRSQIVQDWMVANCLKSHNPDVDISTKVSMNTVIRMKFITINDVLENAIILKAYQCNDNFIFSARGMPMHWSN